ELNPAFLVKRVLEQRDVFVGYDMQGCMPAWLEGAKDFFKYQECSTFINMLDTTDGIDIVKCAVSKREALAIVLHKVCARVLPAFARHANAVQGNIEAGNGRLREVIQHGLHDPANTAAQLKDVGAGLRFCLRETALEQGVTAIGGAIP